MTSKSVAKRLAAQTRLTSEEIDRLSGVELDEAVAMAIGWDSSKVVARYPHVQTPRPVWHTDQGAALGLLMGVKMPASSEFSATLPIAIAIFSDAVSVIRHGETLASGPIAECASVICRAYLKLVNGE